jgi:hypothetical protein
MSSNKQLLSIIQKNSLMKRKLLVPALFIIMPLCFLIQSCCKAYCGVQELAVNFLNYKNTDIDTVLYIKYAANGRFDQKIDSFYRYDFPAQRDTMVGVLTQNVEYDKDWKIKLVSINREYNITDIKTTTKKCTCGNSSYPAIAGYRLDGVLYSNYFFELKK